MVLTNLDRRDENFSEQLHRIQNDKSAAVILLGTEMLDEDADLIRGLTVPFVCFFSAAYDSQGTKAGNGLRGSPEDRGASAGRRESVPETGSDPILYRT